MQLYPIQVGKLVANLTKDHRFEVIIIIIKNITPKNVQAVKQKEQKK